MYTLKKQKLQEPQLDCVFGLSGQEGHFNNYAIEESFSLLWNHNLCFLKVLELNECTDYDQLRDWTFKIVQISFNYGVNDSDTGGRITSENDTTKGNIKDLELHVWIEKEVGEIRLWYVKEVRACDA